MREGRPGQRGRRGHAYPADGGTRSRAGRYRRLSNPFAPLQVFSDDEVEHLHRSALAVLEQNGIRVLSPEARRRFAAGGASVDAAAEIVRIDRGLVEQTLASAPRSIELTALRPDRNVSIGGREVAIAPVAGPPNATDFVRGRRPGTLQDFADFMRLSQAFDVIHVLAPCVEPQDVANEFRHLEMTQAQITLSDKFPFVYSRGTAQVTDCFRMLQIAHGIDESQFTQRAYTWTNVNTNSPRQLDVPMAQGIIDFAAANQVTVVTPFTLAGAMAPITLPGALVLAHAEALAGITLAQVVRSGAPVVYGGFTSNVDMKSGSPAFGTPEYVKACFGAGQLARRVGLPWRSSNVTGSNLADEQATYESAMSLWGALLGGCNLLLHGAGWLEGGLSASFEKFVLDVEMLQTLAETFQPVTVSDAEIGLEAIADVAPGGHFMVAPHTLERYRSAFYEPLVSDWRNIGQWQDDGAKSASQRASEIWQRTLAAFEPPARDPAILEALQDFVTRRRNEGGASPAS
jgi:trimethylamine--corrinoid protein Co-methyltransferase